MDFQTYFLSKISSCVICVLWFFFTVDVSTPCIKQSQLKIERFECSAPFRSILRAYSWIVGGEGKFRSQKHAFYLQNSLHCGERSLTPESCSCLYVPGLGGPDTRVPGMLPKPKPLLAADAAKSTESLTLCVELTLQ